MSAPAAPAGSAAWWKGLAYSLNKLAGTYDSGSRYHRAVCRLLGAAADYCQRKADGKARREGTT